MEKIHFMNGQVMECETVHSRSMYYNGVNRDSLIFVFLDDTPLQDIIVNFVPDNCDQIYLETDDGEKFLHEHYTIRIALGIQERGNLLGIGEDEDHRMVPFVKMVRTTYSEQQIEAIGEVVEALVIDRIEGGKR